MTVNKIMEIQVDMCKADFAIINGCIDIINKLCDTIRNEKCESVICVEYGDIINFNLTELEDTARILHYLQFADEII